MSNGRAMIINLIVGLIKKIQCYGCHDLMQKAMNFNNIAIVYVNNKAYRIHFWYMSKDDAINIMNGSNLVDKRGVLYFFLLYIKMGERRALI